MSFFKDFAESFKTSVSKVTNIIERELSTFVDDNVVFGTDDLTFVAFVRTDATKDRLLWEVQQHLRAKSWKIKHTSKASLMATIYDPFLRTIVVKLGLTPEKQRILHFFYQASEEEPTQAYFRTTHLAIATALGQGKLLKTQEKEAITAAQGTVELSDDTEEAKPPTPEPMQVDEPPKPESFGTVVTRAVLFQEEGEGTDEDTAVCVCHLNAQVTLAIIRTLADQVADGLNCEETSLVRDQGGVVYIVKTDQGSLLRAGILNLGRCLTCRPLSGVEYEFGLTIGYTDDQKRLLLGQYPKEGEFGRDFWRRLAITMAQNHCLFGQTLPEALRAALSPSGSRATSPITSPTKPSTPLQQRNFMAAINAAADENQSSPARKAGVLAERSALGAISNVSSPIAFHTAPVLPKSPDVMDVDL